MTDKPDLNPDFLLEISGGDQELIEEIVAVFRDDVPPRLDEIDAAMGAGDIAEVARVAHSLKGAAGSLGAERLEALALLLEDAAKGGNASVCGAVQPQLRDALGALLTRLDSETWGA